MIIERINQVDDIKRVNPQDYDKLAGEIRTFLIEKISNTGGHLASNLGAVELTMALHLSFHLPEDKLIWDVGHQSYTHKILSGRKDRFDTLRQYKGMSGFPKREESVCDSFDTGHSSTSISAGLGYAQAKELTGEHYRVVSIIGDGAMTGGLAFEALNNASRLKTNFIIVLNDNEMSISRNVGGLSMELGNIRTAAAYQDLKNNVTNTLKKIPVYGDKLIKHIRRTKSGIKQLVIPGMFFEDMGITYLGPVDGHNIQQMIRIFQEAKKVEGAVLVHVVTQKGRGYLPAERHPARFHGTAPFDVETGIPRKKGNPTNTDIFSTCMRKMGDREPKVVAVTAAMADGTGLKRFSNLFPTRFFDVGIAEQHAVTFAAGLSAAGMKPVVAIYSTFLQRAYDEIVHDVCMQKLHVVFAIDRAGLVGSDGQTHHGVFDLSYLSTMPNMVIMAPKNKWELSDMLKFAIQYDGPIALRYARGEAYDGLQTFRAPIVLGRWEPIVIGNVICILAVGSMVQNAEKVIRKLSAKGMKADLVNARFVKPMDEEMLLSLARNHTHIITLEENALSGGFGEHVLLFYAQRKIQIPILPIGIMDQFIEQGSVTELWKEAGIDADTVSEKIEEFVREG